MVNKKNIVKSAVVNFRRITRKQYTAGKKNRIVLEGLRGEESIAELSHRDN